MRRGRVVMRVRRATRVLAQVDSDMLESDKRANGWAQSAA